MAIKTKILVPKEFEDLYNPNYRYFAIYGGRGSLKSHTVARRLIIASREKKCRILCTRELQKSIKDSVHKLLTDIIDLYEFKDFVINKDSITNTITGSEFIFTGIRNNTSEIKSMEGIDFCWCEESQSLTKESIDILTPTIRKEGSQIFFTYNRFNELDPVHVEFVINKKPQTCVINVNYDVAEKYGWFPDVLKVEMENDKVNNPEIYAHKWLGEPLSQSDNAIISRSKILEAMQRSVEDDGAIEIGVDVARMGNDRTVLWKRKGHRTIDYKIYKNHRTTEVCDLIEVFADFDKTILIKIDDTGVGGGVTDEMLKREYEVEAVNFGSKAYDEDKYPNWISEAWFNFKDIIDQIELPYDPDLLMELSTRCWSQDTKAKRRVESKQDYKKRGFRSPDLADACIIAYSNPKYINFEDDIAL
jgi:phage terminase large subunit